MSLYPAIVRAYAAFRELQLARIHRDPMSVQSQTLLRLVRRAADTAWGRQFDYASIHCVAEYQRRVPIQNYASMKPWWQRNFDGEADITWPGLPRWFAATSGTTAGDKYVPVTRALLRSHARVSADLIALYARRRPDRARGLFGGVFLGLGGTTTLERRGAVYVGDASGIAAGRLCWPLTRWYSPGRDIAAIVDWEERIGRIAERAARQNITFLAGIPSWVKVLLDRVIAVAASAHSPSKGDRTWGEGRHADPRPSRPGSAIRDPQSSPDSQCPIPNPQLLASLWPHLTLFVHGGVFFEPYRPIFDQYFAGLNVEYLDIYSASEASIGIQTDPCDPSLLLALDHNVFYEFVPLEQWGRPGAPRLTVADVQTGVSYVILLTTCAGLWSYDLGDIVRFTSLRPLTLRITGRHKLFISAFGENIISEHVEAAVAHACRLTGARVHEYTAAPRFPDGQRPLPAHEYVIEFASPPADMDAFRRAIDAKLCEQSLDYAIKRRGDLAMSCVEVTAVPEGTFYEWFKRRGRLGGQHKVPRCANHREYVDALRAIADEVRAAPG